MAPLSHTAVQLKHTTHLDMSTVCPLESMHSALHTRSHSPQFTQASVFMSIPYTLWRLSRLSTDPTGHTVLHISLPLFIGTATIAASAMAAATTPAIVPVTIVAPSPVAMSGRNRYVMMRPNVPYGSNRASINDSPDSSATTVSANHA